MSQSHHKPHREFNVSLHLSRMLELIALLSRHPLSSPQIVERMHTYYAEGDSGTRRVRADIQQLREWGFVIKNRHKPVRYEMTYNPLATQLNAEQIDVLVVIRDSLGNTHPFGGAINQLLTLLTAHLDDEQRQRYTRAAPIRLELNTAANYDHARPLIKPLDDAIRAQRQVEFAYHSLEQRKAPLRHRVDPYVIEFYQQQLYLVAYSYLSQQITDFRLDRIVLGSLKPLPTDIQPDRDIYPYHFRYRLSAKLARRGISERFHDQQVLERFEDGSVELAARARSQFHALRGLLRYAENARATAPPELVDEMITTLDTMRGRYRD